MEKVTMNDIARIAGVSKSAVSKALRGCSDIGPETQQRIVRIANEMGFYPNNTARSLRVGRTQLIGMLIPNCANTYYSHVLQGVDSAAKTHSYTVVINNTNDDPRFEQDALRTLVSVSVDGIIAVPACCDNYYQLPIPYVFVSRFPNLATLTDSVSFVSNDDASGQFLAIQHLIDCGFRRIAFIMDAEDNLTGGGTKAGIRIAAYQRALLENGIPINQSLIIRDVTTLSDAYMAAKVILEMGEFPMGFAAGNDNIALGILHAVNEKGLSIPQQVGIIGYDDLDFAPHLLPPLSTIHISKVNMGAIAGKMLIGMINGTQQPSQVLLQPYVVSRCTT